ncbi:MAG: 1-deoxy-D-xylulose-5-phosphate reductoisomerase [Deltaproteobacteria bacterium]|jgi:1-deoxy-D-xylulose-5-phosphate reductoisomerase|nr:1-deoxy-D-xylulose-5-phosphate reductoisomerase [Deltaproteobacteria bacterium]MBT4527594.1 1-deoxy-D-xylulose-5-phosphate reductoisomerase [Deltaproteobacteria bacterium]
MVNKQGIVILGSTGSVGRSTLDVIRLNQDRFNIIGLTCQKNMSLMAEQIKVFKPEIVSVGEGYRDQLRTLLGNQFKEIAIVEGESGNIEVAKSSMADKIVAAIVGSAGLKPVFAAIQADKDIALANKETLVLTGDLMMRKAEKHGIELLPLDSEHNAIFQCLMGNCHKDIDHIILTASGGPFRTKELSEFKDITLEEALNHPNWEMGEKITIDSATMMNKCLEVIEAKWLFNLKIDQIKVLVHPQSIIHSMVVYKDGSTLAQMGFPDMKTPIANCLGYPDRIESGSQYIDWTDFVTLTFEQPDLMKFPTIQFAFDALRLGGGAPAALNGANETLVDLFLTRKIEFTVIFDQLQKVLKALKLKFESKCERYLQNIDSIDDAIQSDLWGRQFIQNQLKTHFIN